MAIAKKTLNLDKLSWNFRGENLSIIQAYKTDQFSEDNINSLIIVLAKTELTLYIEEDFDYMHLCRIKYTQISSDIIEQLKNKSETIGIAIDKNNRYYSNFSYKNGDYYHPETGQNFSNIDDIPCLVELNSNFVTYYILKEDYYDYFFE